MPQFFGFCVWVLAGIAVIHRTPFDLPEAEAELAAGYHTEYSGMKFGMFLVAEYVGIVLISSLTVTLFFGGWQVPLNIDDSIPLLGEIPFIWFAMKAAVFMAGVHSAARVAAAAALRPDDVGGVEGRACRSPSSICW